ncbi:hypothetical protein Zmor_001744 [Zophobas morio]|uniref:snRNA-activating protein complex subunit 3 n=1 Tax=Zophobas morio TaxID=2755281 RepID=A0AA38MT56_9CUCU|nr:hypothetical protein Zmor_026033 [Zophobas morio]KAJ3666293.1 hypothetical protein Zmor_001744 [Zophobas morio]
MEEIYPPESYGASGHLFWKTYFEKLSKGVETLPIVNVDGEINEAEYLLAIKKMLNVEIPYTDIKYLSKTCSPVHLTCDGEDTKNFPMELPEHINSTSKLPSSFIVGDTNNLMVNKCLLEVESQLHPLQLCLGNKRNYHKKLDFTIPATPPDLSPGSEFIISVLIYRPVAFRFFNAKNASEKLRFNHEILVLGQNTLTELRDAIVCSADFGLCKEVESTSSDLRPLANAKSIYPSGFIFIDDVFYNDFRDPNAIDYSFPIMEWATKEKKIKNLQAKSMEEVSLHNISSLN